MGHSLLLLWGPEAQGDFVRWLSLIHISEPTRPTDISYAVFGRVVDGMEVVDAIQQGDRITKAAITQ